LKQSTVRSCQHTLLRPLMTPIWAFQHHLQNIILSRSCPKSSSSGSRYARFQALLRQIPNSLKFQPLHPLRSSTRSHPCSPQTGTSSSPLMTRVDSSTASSPAHLDQSLKIPQPNDRRSPNSSKKSSANQTRLEIPSRADYNVFSSSTPAVSSGRCLDTSKQYNGTVDAATIPQSNLNLPAPISGQDRQSSPGIRPIRMDQAVSRGTLRSKLFSL
jgi:hypothetical protein